MKNIRVLAQRLLSSVDYPGEILTGVPVIEIKGGSEIVVISHYGVKTYSDTAVRISSSLGEVLIKGEALSIFRMNRERIVLHGTIFGVEIGANP